MIKSKKLSNTEERSSWSVQRNVKFNIYFSVNSNCWGRPCNTTETSFRWPYVEDDYHYQLSRGTLDCFLTDGKTNQLLTFFWCFGHRRRFSVKPNPSAFSALTHEPWFCNYNNKKQINCLQNIVLWAGKNCTLQRIYSSIQFSSLWKIFRMIYSQTSSGNVDNLKQNPFVAPSNKQTRDTWVFFTSKTSGKTTPERNYYFISGLLEGDEKYTRAPLN